MRFVKFGDTLGDETSTYKVVEYNAKTVVEFINEVLEENPHEWGYFERQFDNFPYQSGHLEYSEGELLNEVPDEWQYKSIESIMAVGGWSRMDYLIRFKEKFLTDEETKGIRQYFCCKNCLPPSERTDKTICRLPECKYDPA